MVPRRLQLESTHDPFSMRVWLQNDSILTMWEWTGALFLNQKHQVIPFLWLYRIIFSLRSVSLGSHFAWEVRICTASTSREQSSGPHGKNTRDGHLFLIYQLYPPWKPRRNLKRIQSDMLEDDVPDMEKYVLQGLILEYWVSCSNHYSCWENRGWPADLWTEKPGQKYINIGYLGKR